MEIVRDSAGDVFLALPGNRFKKITEEQAATLYDESAAESVLNTAGNSIAQLYRGGQYLVTGDEGALEKFKALEETQEARSAARPGASAGGTVLGFAPDVALGVATGGTGTIAKRALGVAVTEGALGAARTPEDPLTGAATQAGIGVATLGAGAAVAPITSRFVNTATDVVQGARQRWAGGTAAPVAQRAGRPAATRMGVDAADDIGDGINAQRNPYVRQAGESPILSPEQMTEIGMEATRAQRAYAAAWETGDEAAIAQAERALANEDFIRKTSALGETTIGDFFNRQDHDQFFTQYIADALGRPDLSRLPYDEVVNIRDDLQKVFKEAFDEGNYPVSTRVEGGADILMYAREVRDAFEAPPKALTDLVNRLEDAVAKGEGGMFDNAAMLEARAQAERAAEAAFKAGKYDTGTSITTVLDTLDEAIEAALPAETQRGVQLARQRWKIKKVLERTSRTMSSTEQGLINTATFQNNWREMTGGYKRHARKQTEMEKVMNTITTFRADRAHAGNTLYRAIGPAAKGAAVVGGAALGANLLGQ